MPNITTNTPYSLGIPEMDRQHQKLINIANDLYDALNRNKGAELLCGILDELTDYTVKHFGDEEKFMRDLGYPDLEEHKKQHEELTTQVIDFHEKVSRGKSSDFQGVTEVMSFLQDWLIDHIAGSDMKYADFMGDNLSLGSGSDKSL